MSGTHMTDMRSRSLRVAILGRIQADDPHVIADMQDAIDTLVAAILNSDDAHWTPAMRAAVRKATLHRAKATEPRT